MKKNSVIIVEIWEGLGNQLFQYAYARALKEKGFDVRLDLDKTYEEVFIGETSKNDPRKNHIQNLRITLPEINVKEYGKYCYIRRDNVKNRLIFILAKHGLWKYRFYEENTPNYSKKSSMIKSNCYVKGWFQDERYFRQIKKTLLKELRPKRKIRISKELRCALEYEESVSLHVRRGDYVKLRHALNVGYYKNAVKVIKRYYSNPHFIVFSDDLEWAKKNLNMKDECIYVNENKKLQDYEELFIMSRCKSNIISNSTFSWWGAWLNCNSQKIVIAPRNYWPFGQRSIVPNEWIML